MTHSSESIPGAHPYADAYPAEAMPVRAYQKVLDWVEAELRTGNLRVGDQLPGERALAETHGISRASVRDAIRTLEVMGLVRTSSGSGPKSGAILISRPAQGMAMMLRMHLASAGLHTQDVIEVRALLESWAASVADLDTLPDGGQALLGQGSDLLEAMEDPDLDRASFQTLDTQFHLVLARLAGNRVVDAMMASLKDAITDYVAVRASTDETWGGVVPGLREQHRRIFDAASNGRGAEAAALLREHIEWFYAQTLGNGPDQDEPELRLP
ncbi:FadR/GntR family transcriptional regulator [Galactobacter sp.]|uniref:FadR/GntR family transcriptional regulator n=1 Tax=Galactobacter sp. TaxID=2676125 RepID=UPI0025C02F65|nr:FCD domain-containing protein [Galactobacter sp.]